MDELSLHADIEEQLIYPAIQEVARSDEPVLVAMEEHEVVKGLLRQLGWMEPDQERFAAKVTVLVETVRRHVKFEERELFPKLRKGLKPAQLRELGERLEEGKKAIQDPRDHLRLG